ncbi:1-aminocyclopropane-1-carboxylate deaminase [Campylobacter sp. MIT 99-7217]|uniref:1-aminocyclopropane-1-carboxylate deaminase/D-cysteine desulfhydrase n=1 Tax=Campylobacter sp. MIT 99-7217 TaxID=535091 RepID=UPI001159ADC5|nr:1-aminocyclopropane-1-carboxylate deaminase/D-cysteine desulfhydrase [Campylobacter sp. MIT 99-7217]TQR34672.1 1-aminocyclopropane-1-carboxylate deaminase [Campylobacter sp. MIT 99-7217]
MKISKIDPFCLLGFDFFVKRDDLISEQINGNKARKLAFYLKQNYPSNQRFISFGGSQSNALVALSAFTFQRAYKLIFVCEKISSFLKQNPCANYAQALKNKAWILENLDFESSKQMALNLCKKGDIFIPQGFACKEAELGYKELANEILSQEKALGLKFDIFLPSGTGTSALFLAKNLRNHQIYTCACVGDEEYLRTQIKELDPQFDFSNLCILNLPKKFHFAKPYKELFEIYKEAKNAGLEFDLLYDSVGLLCVLAHQKGFKKPLLYIHQGGVAGNESMLQRYKFEKNLL